MADLAMAAVEGLGVNAIDVPHQCRQIPLQRLNHEVVMVAHQAIREQPRVKPCQALRYDGQQASPVGVVNKDIFPSVTPGGDVIQRAGELDAKRAGHGAM